MPNEFTKLGRAVGKIMRRLRVRERWSTEELAEKLGYSESVGRHLDAGDYVPSRYVLRRILDRLNLPEKDRIELQRILLTVGKGRSEVRDSKPGKNGSEDSKPAVQIDLREVAGQEVALQLPSEGVITIRATGAHS